MEIPLFPGEIYVSAVYSALADSDFSPVASRKLWYVLSKLSWFADTVIADGIYGNCR